MSELDDAMLERMAWIVFHEHRSFSHRDFLDIMKPKTFRNKISQLKKDSIVELDYNSGIAFYTLKGQPFGKPGTPNHIGGISSSSNSNSLPLTITVGHNDPVYQMIKTLPMDRQAIHDIRAKFQAPNIYDAFSVAALPTTTPCLFPKDDVNCDIRLPYWNVNKATVQVRIHKTDTVSIIIACSLEPFAFDYSGIIRFFNTLAATWGLLVGLTLTLNLNQQKQFHIDHYGNWLLTQWHFGRDSLTTYKGEKYEITVEGAQHVFTRLYAKDFGKYSKIRLESVESPSRITTVSQAIQDKLSSLDDDDDDDHDQQEDLKKKK